MKSAKGSVPYLLIIVPLVTVVYLNVRAIDNTGGSIQHAVNANVPDQMNYTSIVRWLKSISPPEACSIPTFDIKATHKDLRFFNKPKKCVPTFVNNFVSFENGTLTYMHKDRGDLECKYQCNIHLSDWDIKTKPWTLIDTFPKPECDVFEVVCRQYNNTMKVFQDIFLHVKKRKFIMKEEVDFLKDPSTITKHGYNVHLIIVDSISYYNALRGFKKTVEYLENEYKSVPMKRLNKNALNSLPNAHGFLINRRVPDLNDFELLRPRKRTEYLGKGYCNTPLDNSTYIGKYFRQLDYVTMTGEDYSIAAFNWPDCKGFEKANAHHHTHPYELRLQNKHFNKKKIFQHNFEKKCLTSHKYQMDYLTDFMNIYPNNKKFSYTWITNIAHDHLTGFYPYDSYFQKYFEKNKKNFDNSFLFFMSDHGFRFGDYRNTPIGEYEDRNPMLFISVPQSLRTNKQLMQNLHENSNKHVSHYDLYASLLDILTEAGRKNFTNMGPFDLSSIMKHDKIKGKSLFRPINERERDCYSMDISSEYCMCQLHYREFKYFKQSRAEVLLKEVFVKEINLRLKEGKIEDLCSPLTLNETAPFLMKYAINKNGQLLWKVKGITIPGNGLFETVFNEKLEIISKDMDRLNIYGPQAEVCVPKSIVRKFCYCKKLLHTNTPKSTTKQNYVSDSTHSKNATHQHRSEGHLNFTTHSSHKTTMTPPTHSSDGKV
uniref:Sulfatase domain-containing protein n=1 Tax=Rhabditophanes sp. KR3021 TaxID=114890 RepID=A0AC35UD66_9BILA